MQNASNERTTLRQKVPAAKSLLPAKTVPSDKRINGSVAPVDLDEKSFGNTSKLGADFRFGACKVGANWRFYLDALIVPIGSRVQAETFRINVPNASDAVVTKEFYPDIVKDLRPTATVTFLDLLRRAINSRTRSIRTLDERSIGTIKSLSIMKIRIGTRWMRMYRTELVNAESNIWAYSLPVERGCPMRLGRLRKPIPRYKVYNRRLPKHVPVLRS